MSPLLLLASLWSAPAQAGPGWTLILPFGVPQFTHDRPKRGLVHAGVQALAAGASTYATMQMLQYAEAGDVNSELTWRMLSAGTVATFGASYAVSVIDGSRLHQIQNEELALRARTWSAQVYSGSGHAPGPIYVALPASAPASAPMIPVAPGPAAAP